ncbi:EAL domain-containing protein [Vibrio alfacsensis]|uniref:EAL domain-containing protein n=1 Tax=Vibrio alfacsensis TaxID=1074311 RepID=UPI002ADDBDE6|nr:EAL domain-containing protein [Vibrio alfacsensis]WQE75384.1 EAL domain-containing protein [Vibrio alfacsensis]
MKILIIEDDPVQALNLKIQLRELGYSDVHIACCLDNVARITEHHIFDLIFCDIHLPDVDGITLLSEHLNVQITKAVVIVSIVEDSILQLTKGMCHQLGYEFVSTLKKPFLVEDLANCLHSYELHLDRKQDLVPSIQLDDSDILLGFEQNRYFAVYQPQFGFNSGQLVGVEALVRFDHPTHGILSPNLFLPHMARMGLLKDLYVLMLDKATSAVSSISRSVQLSLNVTQDLLEFDLCDITTNICQLNDFPLAKLMLELTEEQACNSSHRALANIARLKIKGVGFSIDDFGTGYASLEQLVDMPFDELKIDRLFISRAKDDYKHQQLTTSAVRLAQSLGLNCVAEGVEDVETWEFLRGLGVDTCQGFYTGKPMPITELLPLYRVVTQDLDQYYQDSQNVVIYLDSNSVRGLATVKLLSKELTGYNIMFVARLDDVYNTVRDLPVGMVVIESDVLIEMEEKDKIELSSVKQRVPSVALVKSESESSQFNFTMPHIVKAETLAHSAKLISEYVLNVLDSANAENTTPLSKRETDVARLLLAGFSNKYIAYELDISQKTVSTFKRRIFSKLGVNSIIELASVIQS